MSNLCFEGNYSLDPVDRLLREDGMEILEDEMQSLVFKENNELCDNLPGFLRNGKMNKLESEKIDLDFLISHCIVDIQKSSLGIS